MSILRRRLSAATVYLIFSGASSLFFSVVITVNLVYQWEVARLSPLQMVLIGTVLETVCFVCQVPTGVLADVYSRRLAVILGMFIIGAGFILEGSIPRFETIVLGQALFGIGVTLADGAEQAWIADEVGEERVGRIFLYSSQIGLLGTLVGALISVGLASIRLNVPVISGGIATIGIAIFLLLFMPENGFHPTPKEERQSWRQLGNTFRNGLRVVRKRPILMTILLIGLFYGLYSEGFDRLSVPHFLTSFTFPTLWSFQPVVWFGLFTVVGSLISIGAMELVRRYIDLNNQRKVTHALFCINALGVGSIFVFALAGNFYLAVAAYLGFGIFRRVNEPIYTTWLTQNIDSKVRATVISMRGQMDALGQIAGGPPVGYIGTIYSLRAALVVVGILLSPVLILFAFVSRTYNDAQTPRAVESEKVQMLEPISS